MGVEARRHFENEIEIPHTFFEKLFSVMVTIATYEQKYTDYRGQASVRLNLAYSSLFI